jgi:hypothetical protein
MSAARRDRHLVFARSKSLRAIGAVGATFLILAYVAPIAVAAAQQPRKRALVTLMLPELRFPGFGKPGKAVAAQDKHDAANSLAPADGAAPDRVDRPAGDAGGAQRGGAEPGAAPAQSREG